MKKITRREAIKTLTVASFSTSWLLAACQREKPAKQASTAGSTGETVAKAADQHFFDKHEMATVTELANIIIPADSRSGNAKSAGVPGYIDYTVATQPDIQTQMRGGINWLDAQCQKRHGKNFVDCSSGQKNALIDEIAFPNQVKPEMEQGAAFFSRMRTLTAAGFWTSEIGIKDLKYKGNQFVAHWDGCPEKACQDLDVTYANFNTKDDAKWLRSVNNKI